MNSKASTAILSTPKASFLILPPEIRNMIYKYLLVSKTSKNPLVSHVFALRIRRFENRRGLEAQNAEKTLAIARTCKQVHDESLPIYFGMNMFYFFSNDQMGKSLGDLSKERRQLLRRIEFKYGGKELNKGFKLLGDCLRLEILQISIESSTFTSTPLKHGQGLHNMDGMKQLKKVRGCKEVVVKLDRSCASEFPKEIIKEFEDMLNKELCKDRDEVKKSAPKGQGKKALAAAAKMKGVNGSGGGNV